MVFHRVWYWVHYCFLYLSLSISKLANPILFADDTSIIILNTNPEEFKNNFNSVMTEITNWFVHTFTP